MFNKYQHESGWQKRKLLFLFLIPAMILLVTAVVQFLWNAILPDLIHVGIITYWQALGLLALCRILFGGFGGRGHKPHIGHSSPAREKWTSMTDEEKVKFKEQWHSRCQNRNP